MHYVLVVANAYLVAFVVNIPGSYRTTPVADDTDLRFLLV